MDKSPRTLMLAAALVLWGIQVVASEFGDTPVNNCTSLRLPGTCTAAPLSSEHNPGKSVLPGREVVIKRTIALPPQQFRGAEDLCQATYAISYEQRNDRVRVSTSIANPTCDKSHGEFEIRVKSRNAKLEPLTQSFAETWSRQDAETVQLNSNYLIGDETDLVWVRVRSKQRISCVCD